MGHSLEQEMAMSQRDKELATETSWQAHYILWAKLVADLKDPCSNKPGWESLVRIYIVFLQYGVNYTNKDGLRAATLAGYEKSVNKLFTLQGFAAPVDLSNPENSAGMKIINHQKEEDIAVQGYPLNLEILAKLATW